jgi:NAD(P)-dependent dehydrogenase (short-subunit alcohol dehydrogenase family)
MKDHFNINVVGPLILFQALYPLLAKRETKKFITVSSLVGAISLDIPVPLTVYGASKAALNFVTRGIHKEHRKEGFIVFPVHPGTVDSDMGKAIAPVFGMEKFPVSPEESASALIKVIEEAGSEQSGRFWNYDGTEGAW